LLKKDLCLFLLLLFKHPLFLEEVSLQAFSKLLRNNFCSIPGTQIYFSALDLFRGINWAKSRTWRDESGHSGPVHKLEFWSAKSWWKSRNMFTLCTVSAKKLAHVQNFVTELCQFLGGGWKVIIVVKQHSHSIGSKEQG
jgi:hypothetical protein